ncbi:Serine protease [Trichinella spiralis]|uniref:Serine protease n=1 Tax=Trichinella spiralis TaxID=6334 RepID=A0ABR3KMV4_TRISP
MYKVHSQHSRFIILTIFLFYTTKAKNTECGNVRQFNYTEDDYFYDRQPFPWTVHLKTNYVTAVECLGVLIQLAQIQKASNTSDLVLTSPKCLGYDESFQDIVQNSFMYNFFVQESIRTMRVFFGQYNSTETLRGSRIRKILTFSDGRSSIPLTVLQLSLPVTFNARRMPICLKEEIPPFSNKCFVSGFNGNKFSLGEYPLRLNGQFPCTTVQRLNLPDISAVCGASLYMLDVQKQGAPLTCFIDGIGYLYGIFVKRIPVSTKRYSEYSLFTEYFTSLSFRKFAKMQIATFRKIFTAKCFDAEEEELKKALSDLYPNHPPFTISTGYLPSTIAHAPSIKYAFTGFHSEEKGLPKAMLLQIKLVEHMPFKGYELPVNQVGIASVELYQSVEYRNQATTIRLPRLNEDLTGIDYCLLGGIDKQGNTKYIEVIIVTHEACKIVYGPRFHSEYMICGLEPKNKLTHTIGAPLICRKHDENVHMGIKINLGVENEPYEDNDMDISAYILISKFDLLYYEPL